MLGKVLRRVLRDEHEAVRNRAATSAPVAGPVIAVIDAPVTAVNGTAHAPRHAGADDADDRRPKPYAEPADASGLLDELERLTKLHDSGALTDEQFEAVKARLLSS
jgi:hypothetical protein